jgi:hypothetical protein
MEHVRFDTQALQNPEISGIEYQMGELAGYELREYLLEKWNRQCAYCDATDIPLNLDHIVSRAKGGSSRASNLTLACIPCNQKKGAKDVRDFVKDKDRLARILKYAKQPLKDAAAVNSTRNRLLEALRQTGLPVEAGSGGRTKWNRSRLSIPKTHALDAVCVGQVDKVYGWERPVLRIKCAGRGMYKRTHLTSHGFPRCYLMRQKSAYGFRTGDYVKAEVPSGKKAGMHSGRISIRASGSFNIQTALGVMRISHRFCSLIQRADGYGYSTVPLFMEKGAGTAQRQTAQRAARYPSLG